MLNKLTEYNYNLPSTFVKSQNLLFLHSPKSELSEFLEVCHQLVNRYPMILCMIDSDLDAAAKEKKRLRLLDKKWKSDQNSVFPGMDMFMLDNVDISANELRLQSGRHRMSSYVVYIFLMLRGFCDGVKNKCFTSYMDESKTIQLFLMTYNEGKIPAYSTISENINYVSNKTQEYIFDAQTRMIQDEKLDDFKELTIDSTSIRANSTWPTESFILTGLVNRIFHQGQSLDKFGMPNIAECRFPEIIIKMKSLNKEINFTSRKPGSKAKRKNLYRELLKEARSAYKEFKSELKKVKCFLSSVNIAPSRYIQLKAKMKIMEDDFQSLSEVIGYCSKRINKDEIIPSKEKTLSLSDKSAAIIKKGDREPVFGYKGQLGRSKNGFITAFELPLGNTADSSELLGMVMQCFQRTKTIPGILSADDGYASKSVRKLLLEMGINIVSISGSKGKKIIAQKDWESDEYIKIRNNRSAVESLMFTIKYCFNFGKVMRRGIENVRAELLGKVLVYNFCRIVEIRKRKILSVKVAA